MNTSAPTPLDQLTALVARRREIETQLADLDDEIRQAAAYVDKSRVPRTLIAKAAGVSLPTLRRWLSQADADQP